MRVNVSYTCVCDDSDKPNCQSPNDLNINNAVLQNSQNYFTEYIEFYV